MRDRKGVALDRRRCEEELEGVEEGKTLPRIYYVKKYFKENNTKYIH